MNKIILFLLLVPTSFLIGQNVQIPQNIPTPNASSLGKYGDVPVSYYTGKVNVNIPIFSLNENNIPLNLSLNYDTGGVKVNELPSWIGQNWNMEAGGVIVRTTKGKAVDELFFDGSWANSHLAQKGYLYNYSSLNVANWTDPAYLKSLVPSAQHDFEPDLFTFNFLGHTGSFFFSQDGTWKVKSDSNLKVEINLADNVLTLGRTTQCMSCSNNAVPPKSIGKITITDEQGNKYVFGNNANAIEYAHNNFFDYYGSLTAATAWYLTSVIDRLGNQVYTFEYDRGGYQAYFYLNQMFSKKQKYKNDSFATLLGNCVNPSIRSNTVGSNLLVPSFLKKITTLGGITINFSRSTSNYKYYTAEDADNVLRDKMFEWSSAYDPLSNSYQTDFYLLIHDANDQMLPLTDEKGNGFGLPYLLNKVKLSQLDAISISDKTTTKYTRLIRNTDLNERLNLIRLENGNYVNGSWVTETSYKFEYNNFGSLPYYLSRAIDHWGYYKGTNFGNSFFNNAEADKYELHYDTRKPDPNYLQIGSLKKIIYPTSGYTEFTYEPHTYSSYVNDRLELTAENDIAGGLRIQKITNFDGIKENIKSYKYTTDIASNISSGILALKNRYYVEWRTYTEEQSVYLEKNFSINNLIPLSNFSGSHIGYSMVFEIEQGNGYKEFQYNSYNEYPDLPYTQTLSYSHSIFDEKNSNDFKRGTLKQLTFYDEQKNKRKEQINIYESIGTNKVRAFNYNFTCPCCPGIFELVKAGNAYEREYSDFKLTSSQEINYFNNKLTTSNIFKYKKYPVDSNFYGSTYLESETNEITNYSKSKKYKYPFDYVGSLETSMLTKNFVPVIETLSFKDTDIIFKKKNLYTALQLNGQQREMLTSTQTAKTDIAYETDKIIDLYDNRGNVIQYHNNNGLFTTFMWGYNKTKIIAKIENATYTQIATALGILTAVLDTYNETNLLAINGLRNNPTLSNCMVNTYTYIPLVGVSSMTDAKGISTYYEYDSYDRLMLVKDQHLNVLQKYCYGYKGQQVDCENDNPYGVSYKSIARNGSFTKNNCASGGIGSIVPFSQAAGIVTSIVSQADADAKGLALFNTNGQANANSDVNAFCTFSSIARSGSFTKNNCASGGITTAVVYNQSGGAATSTISQADADAKGLALFNTNGQANANISGICTFSSIAQSGPFTRNTCTEGMVGSTVTYTQAAGAVTSTVSQADADDKGLSLFYSRGRSYANVLGTCYYASAAINGTVYKNDCPEGYEGSSMPYSLAAGAVTSTTSQSAADADARRLFETNGHAIINANGTCTKFITYLPKWNPVNKAMALLATATSANHNGVTLRFMIHYRDSSFQNISQPAVIVIAAGKTTAAIQMYLLEAKENPTVELIAIERN